MSMWQSDFISFLVACSLNLFVPIFFLRNCDLYTCVFVEYYSQGQFDIPSCFVDPHLFRLRYGALLWQYGSRKMEEGVVSESEGIAKVDRRLSAPTEAKEYISVSDHVGPSKLLSRRKIYTILYALFDHSRQYM